MSQVTDVQRARKPQACGKCGAKIEIGAPYRWTQVNRFAPKKVRCPGSGCRFRPSELVSNDKVAAMLSAQESAETAFIQWVAGARNVAQDLDAIPRGEEFSAQDLERVPNLEDVRSLLSDMKAELDEVVGQYQEAYDNLPENFQQGEAGETLEERRQELEEYADGLEQAELTEFDPEDKTTVADWLDQLEMEFMDVLSDLPGV